MKTVKASLFFSICLLFLYAIPAQAQKKKVKLQALESDSLPSLRYLKDSLPEEKKREAKGKKNIYYGKRVRKAWFKNNNYIEIFHYLKEHEEPNKYVEEIAWFYPGKGVFTTEFNKVRRPIAKILHGPYEKRIGDKVIEQGFYYVGTKHGRWEKFGKDAVDTDFVLIDKSNYFRGWLKESQLSYYDLQRTKLKEAIPIKYGKKHGTYFQYYANGVLAEKGSYEYDKKIGLWTEYYETGSRLREIQHPRNYNDNSLPVILREWDSKGKLKESKAENKASGGF